MIINESKIKIVECVPNFSEGRQLETVERIVQIFRSKENIKLLNYNHDKYHNRMVVTAIGEPDAMKKCIVEAVGVAIDTIDLNKHEGQHPRIGATDVIPFIPIKNISLEETDVLAKEVGQIIAEKYRLPIYFYEKSASAEHRINLSSIRKGEFEGLVEKMTLPEWKPDIGPDVRHPTAGATVIGARLPLIAFNVNLYTTRFDIADRIAKKVRSIGGGLSGCKAMAVDLKDKGLMQVSMNLTDYTKTTVYQVVEMIRFEAKRYGVSVAECELIGMIPLQALVDTASYYLGLENFTANQILEVNAM